MQFQFAAKLERHSAKSDIKHGAAGISADNMVIQQGIETPVWGTVKPNETITVLFAGHRLHVKAGSAGRWRNRLPAMNLTLLQASNDHKIAMQNLMQFYIYDFSAYIRYDVEDDGLFGLFAPYPDLNAYWEGERQWEIPIYN